MRCFVAARFLAFAAALSLFGCRRIAELPAGPGSVTSPASPTSPTKHAAHSTSAEHGAKKHARATLERIELKIGSGPVAEDGDSLTVGYIGRYMNGKVFGTRGRHDPFTFTLGSKKVIQGWNEGIVGMRVGGKRRLVIPAYLAYGAAGKPPRIPPNAPLWYDVDLFKINAKH